MTEFEFIATYLRPLAGKGALNLEDDAAVWTPAAGKDIVVSTDTLIEGVHFPSGHFGGEVAERALRVNLSDAAAMGATPFGYLLNLTLPTTMPDLYLKGFAAGLRQAQNSFDVHLLGGDTTRADGPMSVTITIMASVPEKSAVKRSGAGAGDHVFVSGPIGDAAMGLRLLTDNTPLKPASGAAIHTWEEAYWRPQPRLDLRKIIRKHASAAIDISDGLVADCGHIATASGVEIVLKLADIPLSDATQAWVDAQKDHEAAHLRLACEGDDYQLLFTVPELALEMFEVAIRTYPVRPTKIGTVGKGAGVIIQGQNGQALKPKRGGYTHF